MAWSQAAAASGATGVTGAEMNVLNWFARNVARPACHRPQELGHGLQGQFSAVCVPVLPRLRRWHVSEDALPLKLDLTHVKQITGPLSEGRR